MKVKLLRPLDGKAEGSIVEYPDIDAKALANSGVVELIDEKAAPAASNKKAPEPENKAVGRGKRGE